MRLTRGEGWWLLRRRVGMTCADMASIQDVSEDRLRRWEYDREAAPMPTELIHAGLMGRWLRQPLTAGEWCALERRRRGWTLPEAARRIGISRQTLWKAEWDRTRGVGAVRRFYERLGPARPTTACPVRIAGPGPGY
jgi:DNA-binding XRE family transcriptional regulator